MSILYEKIKATAQTNAQKTAIVFYGKRYKFGRILSLVEKAASGLKSIGINKGSVVTLCMPNSPSAQIAFYAINRLGAVVNLVHPFISADSLAQSVKKTRSRLIIAYDLFLQEKGSELKDKLADLKNKAEITDVTVLLSRSDYFMGLPAKIYFNLLQKNRKPRKNTLKNATKTKEANKKNKAEKAKTKIKYQTFEALFKNPEITDKPVTVSENDASVYLPSGGTSGSPKIIAHRAGAFNELCAHAQFFLSDTLENYSAMYTVLPIFHGFGLCMCMHMCAILGVKNVMSMKFNPRSVTKAIKKEHINVIMGVPAMFAKLLEYPGFLKADLSSLKDCFVGGDAVPKKLVDSFNHALKTNGGTGRLYVGYGLTETVTVCTVNCSKHNREDSVGYPLPGAELAVVKDGKRANCGEIGEILIKTPLIMLEYLDDKNLTAENPVKFFEGDRWLFTGDLGFLDKDGFLFFKQRIKNILKVNGIPVYPCEIEEAAEGLPWVVRAAAVGIADKHSGEVVKLYVEVPAGELKKFFQKEPDKETLKDMIIKQCEQTLIRYAIPKVIEIREALPLNSIGKVDRKKLD